MSSQEKNLNEIEEVTKPEAEESIELDDAELEGVSGAGEGSTDDR